MYYFIRPRNFMRTTKLLLQTTSNLKLYNQMQDIKVLKHRCSLSRMKYSGANFTQTSSISSRYKLVTLEKKREYFNLISFTAYTLLFKITVIYISFSAHPSLCCHLLWSSRQMFLYLLIFMYPYLHLNYALTPSLGQQQTSDLLPVTKAIPPPYILKAV